MDNVLQLEETVAIEEFTIGKKLKVAWKYFRKRINPEYPMAMLHALTEACNAHCSFCNFRHGKRRPDELTLEEITSLYQQGKELGIFYLHIWGGEPSIHPELGAIVQTAKKNDYIVGMISNGWKIAERINEIIPYVDRYYFSVDYPGKHHNIIRSTPKLYESIISAVEAIRSKSKKKFIMFTMTLSRQNMHAVEEMANLCNGMDVALQVVPMRQSTPSSGEQVTEKDPNANIFLVDNNPLMVPFPEQKEAWEKLIALKNQGYNIHNSYSYMQGIVDEGKIPRYRCHWPKIGVSIDANGDVVDCQRWDQPIGNIRSHSLKELLDSSRVRELKGKGGESCNLCTTPTRFEPSQLWDMNLQTLFNLMRSHQAK